MAGELVLLALMAIPPTGGGVMPEVRPTPPSTSHVLIAVEGHTAPPFEGLRRIVRSGHRTWIELDVPEGDSADAVIARFTNVEGIVAAQPVFHYQPDVVVDDPHFARQYAHRRTQADLAWNIETGHSGVVVAVVGTGVQPDHPDLAANLWINAGEIASNDLDDDDNGFVDDVRGWDFVDDDGEPTPMNSHETAVAGVIGAVANNGEGVVGVSWHSRLMPIRIDYETITVAGAIDYAVANGADVINLSFGSYEVTKYGTDTMVEAALRRAETSGVVVVSTAGNNAIRTPRFPAALPTVLAVAATDELDERAHFSNYGNWIDVAAPGAAIYTTRHDSYGLADGTSMAAPYVSGVAALVRARHPSWSAEAVRDVVRYTGDPIVTDRFVGNSRVNVFRAVTTDERPATFARIAEPRARETLPRGSIVQVHGTAIGTTYTLEISEDSTKNWATIETGITTRNGRLGLLDTKDLAPGAYHLRLVTQSGEESTTELIPIAIDDGFLDGFPVTLDAPAGGTPQIVDLDGDGDKEIVVVSTDGSVAAHHHDGSIVAGWPVTLNISSVATPAIGDVDGDGDVEVIVSGASVTGEGRVMAWHHDGSVVSGWPIPTERTLASVVLADVDRDRDLEIIMVDGGRASGRIDIRHGNGVSHVGWPVTTSLNFESAPVVGDLDGDGELEIAVSGFENEYVLNVDGTTVTGWPQNILGSNMNLAMGDVDLDGALDLVTMQRHEVSLVGARNHVHTGWPRRVNVGPYSTSALADLDADGHLEVVVVSTNGAVFVFDRDGTTRAGWPKTQLAELSPGVAIADLDEDGRADVLVTATDGRLYAWSGDGEAVNGFPKRLDDMLGSSATLDDVDGDGRVDVVVVNGTRLHALALGRRFDAATLEWPSGRHDVRNSGHHPRSFELTLTSTAIGTVRILAREANDIPHPARYDVYRNRELVGVTIGGRFVDRSVPPVPPVAYRLIAIGYGEEVLARSNERFVDPVTLFCRSNPIGTPCDDDNPCTDGDVCNGVRCGGQPAAEGRTCDDDNLCTSNEVCSAGACVGQAHVECPSGPCLISICEPTTGACTVREQIDTTSCEDGDPCTVKDACLSGSCIAGRERSCEATAPCRSAGLCDATLGGCVFESLVNGTACDDGDSCTTADACDAGRCVGTMSPMCATPRPCELTNSCPGGTGAPESVGCGCTSTERRSPTGLLVLFVLGLCFRMVRKCR